MFVGMHINWDDIFLYGGLVFFIGGLGGIAYWYLLEETYPPEQLHIFR
jgi:hypothetical protein